MTIKENDTDRTILPVAKADRLDGHVLLKKKTPLRISNQANHKCWKLFWRVRNSHVSFMVSKMLFEWHSPELHGLLEHLHKRDNLHDRLHGVGTHDLL